jgi:hypothetical protein
VFKVSGDAANPCCQDHDEWHGDHFFGPFGRSCFPTTGTAETVTLNFSKVKFEYTKQTGQERKGATTTGGIHISLRHPAAGHRAMAELTPKERLQPSLLDRLTDDEPESGDRITRVAGSVARPVAGVRAARLGLAFQYDPPAVAAEPGRIPSGRALGAELWHSRSGRSDGFQSGRS